MFKQLLERARRLSIEAVAFDPSGLNDPLAMRTEWGPARGGGASFETHRLVEVDSWRSEFRAAPGALVVYLIFLGIGLGMSAFWVVGPIRSSSDTGTMLAFVGPVFIGLVFAAIGGAMLWYGAAPIVFDKRRGEYWKGRVAPHEASNRGGLKHFAELERVHAVQILSERCRSKNSSYLSYELNLVMDDGSRMNVVDHGNLDRLREDASKLAAFLGKPVWDATA